MTDEELRAIRSRCDAATPGSWVEKILGHEGRVAGLTILGRERVNARFIAHSRTDVPRLLDEIVELRRRIEQAKSTLKSALTDDYYTEDDTLEDLTHRARIHLL